MKVAVSYLDSLDIKKTIKLIDRSVADYIHVDLMDGKFVVRSNINNFKIEYFKNLQKPLDIHMMTKRPEQYLPLFDNLKIKAITVHPLEVSDFSLFLTTLHNKNINVGIAINPDEEVKDFTKYLLMADQVLVMGVFPGQGGQKFIPSVIPKIEEIKKINENIIVGLDGGINNEIIKLLKDEKVDYVVSGSFIWQSNDYNSNIKLLKKF